MSHLVFVDVTRQPHLIVEPKATYGAEQVLIQIVELRDRERVQTGSDWTSLV